MKLARTAIGYEDIAVMLDLPSDVRIVSVDQDADDRVNKRLQVVLEGPHFYEHQRGAAIWQTPWPPHKKY